MRHTEADFIVNGRFPLSVSRRHAVRYKMAGAIYLEQDSKLANMEAWNGRKKFTIPKIARLEMQ